MQNSNMFQGELLIYPDPVLVEGRKGVESLFGFLLLTPTAIDEESHIFRGT